VATALLTTGLCTLDDLRAVCMPHWAVQRAAKPLAAHKGAQTPKRVSVRARQKHGEKKEREKWEEAKKDEEAMNTRL